MTKKEMNDICDKLSYGLGMTSERHMQIFKNITRESVRQLRKHETIMMAEIEMCNFITKNY